jgi:hypothetical protein
VRVGGGSERVCASVVVVVVVVFVVLAVMVVTRLGCFVLFLYFMIFRFHQQGRK